LSKSNTLAYRAERKQSKEKVFKQRAQLSEGLELDTKKVQKKEKKKFLSKKVSSVIFVLSLL